MSQTRDITSEYRLKRVLKAATLSTVFQAADPQSDQEVAIKLLSPAGAVAGEDKRARFLHAMEAIKSSGLDSFPRLIDVGFTPESSAFMVMELAHGAGLDTLSGQPPARLLPILMQVVVALEDLAKKGVWHHNLSPDNLLVDDDDSVHIIGLGTAAFLAESDGGVPEARPPESDRYVAPEQLDPATVTPGEGWLSDLYSMSVITCELLAAEVQDPGTDSPAIAIPEAVRAQLGDAAPLEQALASALRRDPSQREVSYAELRDALRDALPETGKEDATMQMQLPTPPLPDTDGTVAMPLPTPDVDGTMAMPLPTASAAGPSDSIAPPPHQPPADGQEPAYDGAGYDTLQMDPVGSPPGGAEGAAPTPPLVPAGAEPGADKTVVAGAPLPIPPTPPEVTPEPDAAPATAGEAGSTTMLPLAEIPTGPAGAVDGEEPAAAAADVPPLPELDVEADRPEDAQPAAPLEDKTRIATPLPPVAPPADEVPEPPPVEVAAAPEPLVPPADKTVIAAPLPSAQPAAPPDVEAPPEPGAPPKPADEAPGEDKTLLATPLPPVESPTSEQPTAAPPEDKTVFAQPLPEPEPPAPSPPPKKPYDPRKTDPTLTSPPVSPPPVAEAPPAVKPTPPPSERRAIPWVPIIAGGGALAVVAILVVVVLMIRGRPEPEPEVAPTAVPTAVPTAMPTAAPVVAAQVHPQLEVAEAFFLEGDSKSAREALAELTSEEVEAFSESEIGIYDELRGALEGMSLDKAVNDLDVGLKVGSIIMLGRAVPALSDAEADQLAEFPGIEQKIEKARDALRRYRLLKRAHDSGDQLQVLERSTSVLQLIPGNSKSRQYRESAARAIEAQADAAVAAGQYGRALASYEEIRKHWPDRSGLADRVAGCKKQQNTARHQQQVLDQAVAKGKAGDPEAGLRLLSDASPTGKHTKLYRDARQRMEAQLAKMDANSPQVTLVNEGQLVFKKKEPARVHIRITDDYRVVSAKAMLRPEGKTNFRELALSETAPGQYLLEVPPAAHGGADVAFYIKATDRSGHVGTLGSAQKPLLLKKKKWFK